MKSSQTGAFLFAAALLSQSVFPVWGANGDPDVNVSVRSLGGDKVELKVSSTAPLKKLSVRWLQNPRRIRLTLSGAHLTGKSGKFAIDKGILQYAEAQGSSEAVTLDLATISNPRSKIALDGDQRTLTWTASVIDIAKGDELPALPSGGVASASNDGKANSKPAAKPPTPKPPAAKAPQSTTRKPANPGITRVPVVNETPTPRPPAENPPASGSAPAADKPGDRLVSLSANGDLRQALENLAKAAGLQAEIDPGVQGTVAISFTDYPLNRAVSTVLGRQATLFEYKITDKVLKVTAPEGSGGTTVVPVDPAPPGRPGVSDYFPIKDKKASDMVEVLRKAFPGLSMTVDERLNQILAEGSASEIERLRKLLGRNSVK